MLFLVATLTVMFLVVAAIGAAQAARADRVLGFMEPGVQFLRTTVWQGALLLFTHARVVGWVTTATAAAVALIGLVASRSLALPLPLLAAAIGLAAWGQVWLDVDQPQFGVWFYAFGIGCVVMLGAICPLDRLNGVPRFPPAAEDGTAGEVHRARRLSWGWEWGLVVALALVGLLVRVFALDEHPKMFETEMIDSVIMSRTLWSVATYFRSTFMSNSAGIVHLLPGPALFTLFGTSVYTVRLIAVVFGFVAIPLQYWLLRRVAGVGAAVVGTALLICAPEQLYWSRSETGGFVPVAVLALVTAHLGLWVVERFSPWAVLAAALWTPLCRFFYTPAYVVCVYPLMLYAHSVVFVRRAWRTAWYVVPLLVGGLVLWFSSISIVFWYVNDWHWRFLDPTVVFGSPAWRMAGTLRDAAPIDLPRLQFLSMRAKLGEVIAGFWYDSSIMLNQWFSRGCASPQHVTVVNDGIAVMFALGLGYLGGQMRSRRACVLLLWVVLGILPAIMSNEPTARRLSVMLPAVYVIAGVWVAGVVGIVRTWSTRWLAWVTATLLGLVIAATGGTGLASHFLVESGPVWATSVARFAAPLFNGSDAIYHNLGTMVERATLLGNLDVFLASAPCYEAVDDTEWLPTALRLPCNFKGQDYLLTMPVARQDSLQHGYNPQRISFLVWETSYNKGNVDLLQQLFPNAAVQHAEVFFGGGPQWLARMTVDIADVRALRSPSLMVADEDHLDMSGLLEGVTLTPTRATERAASDGSPPVEPQGTGGTIVARGGLFLDADGWYRFAVAPECPEATLSVAARPSSGDGFHPMGKGVYPFELSMPSQSPCRLPLQILQESEEAGGAIPVSPWSFTSHRVASLPRVRALPIATYDGYGEASVFAELTGEAVDMAVDAQGRVTVLVRDQTRWRVQRFSPDGHEAASWLPVVESDQSLGGIAVDADGTVVVAIGPRVQLYDQDGKQQGGGSQTIEANATGVALTTDGRILVAMPGRNAIAVFDRGGRFLGRISEFAGDSKPLSSPTAVAIGPEGALLVVQENGRALLGRVEEDVLHPAFVRDFPVDFRTLPVEARGCTFDGPERLLMPDPVSPTPLVYSTGGERLMAADRGRDLGTKNLGPIVQFRPVGDRLYALGSRRIWSIAR